MQRVCGVSLVRATRSVINSLLIETVVVMWLQRVRFNLSHGQERSDSLIIVVIVLIQNKQQTI